MNYYYIINILLHIIAFMSLQHFLIDNQSMVSLKNSPNSRAANHIFNNSSNNTSSSRFRTYLETKLGFAIPTSKKDIYDQIQNKIQLYNKNIQLQDENQQYWSQAPEIKSPFKQYQRLYKQSNQRKTIRANSTTKFNSKQRSTQQHRLAIGKTPRSKIIEKGEQPYQLQFHDYATLVKQLPKIIHNIYYIVQERSVAKLLKMCVKILAISIRQQSAVLMQNTLIFFGWIYEELAQYELSLFLFQKGKSIAKFFKADVGRAESLLGIAKNLKKLSRNTDAIIFLKRSLQYLWRSKGIVAQSLQIEINQELSFNFLALGNRQLSNYFRQRYEQGTLQGKNSTIMKLSNDIVNAFQRNLIRKDKLDSNIEVFLNVDFLEIQKILLSKAYIALEGSKGVEILNNLFKINFDIYLQSVLKDNQYSDDIPLPLNPSNQQIRQKIDSHIEKKNKMKFIPPLKIRTISSVNLGKQQKITIIKDKSIKRLAFSSGINDYRFGSDGQQSLSKNIVGRAQTKRLISKKKIESHFKIFSKNISSEIQVSK